VVVVVVLVLLLLLLQVFLSCVSFLGLTLHYSVRLKTTVPLGLFYDSYL
jgi:hypothetical protein